MKPLCFTHVLLNKKRVASPKDIMHIKSSSLLYHTHIHTLFFFPKTLSKFPPTQKIIAFPYFPFLSLPKKNDNYLRLILFLLL